MQVRLGVVGVDAEPERGGRHELAESARAGRRDRVRIPRRLDRDQRDHQAGVEVRGIRFGDDAGRQPDRLLGAELRVERPQRRGVRQQRRSEKRREHTSSGARPTPRLPQRIRC